MMKLSVFLLAYILQFSKVRPRNIKSGKGVHKNFNCFKKSSRTKRENIHLLTFTHSRQNKSTYLFTRLMPWVLFIERQMIEEKITCNVCLYKIILCLLFLYCWFLFYRLCHQYVNFSSFISFWDTLYFLC